MNARVLVADDHTIVRQGLCSVLRGCAGIEVVGEASTGREAVERALRTRPDVVLMDARMPDMGGAEATRRILGRRPGTRVIAMSAYSEKGIVRQMLDAGACCYLLKDCDLGELRNAINSALAGGTYLSPAAARAVMEDRAGRRRRAGTWRTRLGELSEADRRLIGFVAEGMTSKAIGGELGISQQAVSKQRIGLMQRLGVTSTAALVELAVRKKLVHGRKTT